MNKKCIVLIFGCVIPLSTGSNERFAYGVRESSLYNVQNPRYIQQGFPNR